MYEAGLYQTIMKIVSFQLIAIWMFIGEYLAAKPVSPVLLRFEFLEG